MSSVPEFDADAAHRRFSTMCFNAAWDLMDKPERTAEEDRLMLSLGHASVYHWLQRPDCDDQHLSVGYWQISRIHALLRNGQEARRAAEVCLAYSESLPAFYLGYAYEALARAAALTGDAAAATGHASQAAAFAGKVEDDEDRTMLLSDLASLDH